MAHLWIQNENLQWDARPLAGEVVDLSGRAAAVPTGDASVGELRCSVFLRAVPGTVPPDWLLLVGAGADVAVNGVPERLGLRVLAERDEVRLGGGKPMFFSAEERVAVQPFPGGARAAECPRCRQEIVAGTPAVRCPGLNCGVWYHQSDDLPCYTYAEKCARCPRKTALDTGFDWAPEES